MTQLYSAIIIINALFSHHEKSFQVQEMGKIQRPTTRHYSKKKKDTEKQREKDRNRQMDS